MPILNTRDKIIYTDFPYNLNWMPYLDFTSNGNIYFCHKKSVYSKISSVEEYFKKIESLGIKNVPLSDLIVGELESIIEVSKNEVIVNGELLTKITSLTELSRCFGREIVSGKKGQTFFDDYRRAMLKKTFVSDHLGNRFSSTKEMCVHYGLNASLFYARLKRGWSLEKTLTTKAIFSHSIQDHLGNEFSSMSEMARHYDIEDNTFRARMRMGWSLEKTLTTPVRKSRPTARKSLFYKGKKYSSLTELAREFGIPETTFFAKMDKGFPVEKIIEEASKKVLDHLGKEYPSTRKMCLYYGIDLSTFNYRIKHGMSLKEALTNVRKNPIVDHLGNEFKTRSEMLDYYKLSEGTFKSRIQNGWSLEKALTTKTKTKK